jgi:uncharacterized membrane protein
MSEIVLPQPDEVSTNEKDDAMGAYLMMFASWAIGLPLPLFNLVAALIYFSLNGRESRYVAFHAYQSLLSQIPVTLLNAGALGWLLAILFSNFGFSLGFFIYLLFVVAANLLYVVFSVVALVRARRGEMYYLSVFGTISFARYYGPNAILMAKRQNRPPTGG